MSNRHISHTADSAYDPSLRDFYAIRDALSAKPELLKRILNKTEQADNQHVIDALHTGKPVKADIPKRLAHSEKLYQAAIAKQSEQLYTLFKTLPVEQKVELIIHAEKIGEINDKARRQAGLQMQAERAKALAAHQVETVRLQAANQAPANTAIAVPAGSSAANAGTQDASLITEAGKPQAPQEKGLISQVVLGNPAAVTVNFPFTVIPGLPALSKMLEKIDKTTHFDLGFTIKGVADREPNPAGGHNLLYRLSYVGAGIMSSKFNVQFSPMALKAQESSDKDRWGGNSSIFTRHKTDNMGDKYSLNFNDSDGSISYAHEYSYQKPSNRLISTLTGGHHFSTRTSPALRIPAEVVPTLDRIEKALPSKEEADIIFDRIDKVNPVNQAIGIASACIAKIDATIEGVVPTLTASIYLLRQKIAETGLPDKEQAAVLARACKHCEDHAVQGSLPAVQIIEDQPLKPLTLPQER